jgi:hypothetical protein
MADDSRWSVKRLAQWNRQRVHDWSSKLLATSVTKAANSFFDRRSKQQRRKKEFQRPLQQHVTTSKLQFFIVEERARTRSEALGIYRLAKSSRKDKG